MTEERRVVDLQCRLQVAAVTERRRAICIGQFNGPAVQLLQLLQHQSPGEPSHKPHAIRRKYSVIIVRR